jgi:hypothetical protein
MLGQRLLWFFWNPRFIAQVNSKLAFQIVAGDLDACDAGIIHCEESPALCALGAKRPPLTRLNDPKIADSRRIHCYIS